MNIDKAIEKYRKLSTNDRCCNKEEAMQIAEWLEELKEYKLREFQCHLSEKIDWGIENDD